MSGKDLSGAIDADDSQLRDEAIERQYESYPYPERDPADESKRLLRTILDAIPCINHFVFGGEFDFSRTFRVLVAGGGTGDSLVYLAQQLHDYGMDAQITYVDVSAESRRIAEQRVRVRKLDNVRFLNASLLDLARLDIGEFDYINCSGVLHHLEDPLAGLRSLAGSMSARGGLGLMLYAALGRTGVYPVQEMLRVIAPATLSSAERIRIARKLIAGLPELNWLNRNGSIAEHRGSDIDLYDLLLNPRDRAYSVESAADLLASAGLRIQSMMPPCLFEPATHIKDQEVLERISDLRGIQRAAFAEKLAGVLNKLVFYAVRAENNVALPDRRDLGLVPFLSGFPPIPDPAGAAIEFKMNGPYFYGNARLAPNTAAILRLMDARRRLEDIRRELGFSPPAFNEALEDVYPPA